MKITDITDQNRPYIEISDFENFFDIYEDRRGNNSYNLNETLFLDIDENDFKYYTCKCRCFWPLISYQLYKTPRLSWLLMKINNIESKNMFKAKEAGDVIRYLPLDSVNYILGSINVS